MSIAFRAAGTVTTGTTAITSMPEPSGTATGDCLVALILDHATTGTTTAPTGWTRQGGAAGTGGRFQVFTAIVGQGGLTGTTWTWSSLTTTCEGVILGFTGVDPINPLDSVTPSARVNASGTKGTTAITPNTANDMVIAAYAALASGSTLATPTLTDPASGSLALAVNQSNSTHSTLAAWYGLQTTASTTGASGITMGTAGINSAILLALKPAIWTHIQGVQEPEAGSSAGSTTITLTNNPATGNNVVVALGINIAASPASTFTIQDSNGNTYTLSPSSPYNNVTTGILLVIATLLNAPSNATKTITATWNTTDTAVAWAEEFALGSQYGIAQIDTDATAVHTLSGTTNCNLPSITPATSDELFYAVITPDSTAISAPIANAALGVWVGAAGGLDSNAGCAAEYALSVTGATAVDFTDTNTTDTYGCLAIAIKAGTVSLRECMLMGIGF